MLPTRKSITRSRNGCAVCKSKRLKCDEARPSCSRCDRLGIPCPGYQKPLKWATGPRSAKGKARAHATPADESGSPQQQVMGYVGYAFDPLDPCSADFGHSEFLEQFTSITSTGSGDLHNDLDSPFSFTELPGEMRYSDPEQSPGLTSHIGSQESNEDSLWPNTLLSTDQALSEASGNLDRLGSPMQPSGLTYGTPQPPQALQDHSTVLVEYYFKEVCGLMSCYDSQMNPYRTAVSKVWSQSQSLYYIIQSMAAACLSEVSPNLSPVGRQLRDKAVSCLSKEASMTPTMNPSSMLALVMLGMSLSWHDPSSLGQSEFALLAKTVLSAEARDEDSPLTDKQNKFFFYNSLIYWQMLLSFVSDRDLALPPSQGMQPQPPQVPANRRGEQRMPHPQTGTGIEVQELVAQVGSLVRGERKRIHARRCASREDIEQSKKAIRAAEHLHSKLCDINLPIEAAILDSGDSMTPTTHLLKIAEAYRCTGLLQLYRNFPDLLSLDSSDDESSICQSTQPGVSDNGPASADDTKLLANTWLTCLALHILDLVQDIPVSSRSRSIQPLLLVSICSELSQNRSFCPLSSLQQVQPLIASLASSPRIKATPTIIDVLQARRAVVSRLSSFENILAAKPVRRMLTLVKETWAWMDEKGDDVYWMDVMIEKGYETLMG